MNTQNIAIRVFILAMAVLLAGAGCSERTKHGPSSQSATATPMVIEPGVGVGKVRAGMTIQHVVAELGEPDNKMGKVLNYVRSGFSVIPTKAGTVGAVVCGDPEGIHGELVKAFQGRTKEGIGMNSTRAEVIQAYGAPTKVGSSQPGHETLIYTPQGLRFMLQDGRVHHMVVNLRDAQ
jgi:hypothetical protein